MLPLKQEVRVVRVNGRVVHTLQSRITGSHHIYEQLESGQILSIPVHSNKDLKTGTLKALMKIAELTEDDL